MFKNISPKLPMRNKGETCAFYTNQLGFSVLGSSDFDGYLMVQKDNIEIHFFEYKSLDVATNYGQVYIRVDDIDGFYQSLLDQKISIHPNGRLETKPWGQREFSMLDPSHNLLTFGQELHPTLNI